MHESYLLYANLSNLVSVTFFPLLRPAFVAQYRISQFGKVCLSSFARSSVTCVPLRFSNFRFVNTERYSSPSFVTFPGKHSVCSFVRFLRCFNPASLTCVKVRFSDKRLLDPSSCFKPSSVIFFGSV